MTTLGGWKVGDKANLERSLKIGDELGGHMVSGHVDGVAEIVERRDFDGMAHFTFRAPAALAKFIAVKGSVALDGVSLTVNAVDGDQFEVLLIPHTLEVTTLSGWKVGDRVNIEVDQMARYAARLVEAGGFWTQCASAPSPVRGKVCTRSRAGWGVEAAHDAADCGIRHGCRSRLRQQCSFGRSAHTPSVTLRVAPSPFGGRALTRRTAARRLRASPGV